MSDLMQHQVASGGAVLVLLMANAALACPDANSSEFPHFGRIILPGTYNPDPFRVSVLGGGYSAIRDCDLGAEGLAGYEGDGLIDVRPDVVVDWQGAGSLRLAFTVENEADTLLVIQDPQGGWHFDDNGREHNPMVVFEEPRVGEYAIFVGVHGTPPANGTPGDLIITETGP